MNRIAKLFFGVVALAVAFAACNNEPPECASDPFSPLRCQLTQLSGKKIDTVIIAKVSIDSVITVDSFLCRKKQLPNVVAVPLEFNGDTTYVQFTLIGKTKTAVEVYSTILCVASTPEINIVNIDCGPVYNYHDLDFSFKSVSGIDFELSLNDSVVMVDTINYKMSIDSLQIFSYDVDQDYEVHAKIFF